MRNALIGYSGFVGSHLNLQHNFNFKYNSKNFREMQNQEYDLVVCSGVSAVKWKANKEPQQDRENIQKLAETLKYVKTENFILISTIDVYAETSNHDEDYDCTKSENHAYGKNRLEFEKFCNEQFKNCTIVRLPGLFGEGIKKNVIFDLLNNNCLEMINVESEIQYYDLKDIWNDIQKAQKNNLKLINLFTEPLSTFEIIECFFPDKEIGGSAIPKVSYDLKTKYSKLWNNSNGYICSKNDVLQKLSKFINDYKSGNRS